MKRTTGALIALLCIANVCYGTSGQNAGERFSSNVSVQNAGILFASNILEKTMEFSTREIMVISRSKLERLSKSETRTYWTVQVGEYQVSLQDFTPGESLKLVFGKGGTEKVVRTYQKGEYETPEDITAVPFDHLLGHNGVYISTKPNDWSCFTEYYGIEGQGLVCLADSWGYERNDYMVDIDGDGDKELICNVTFLADGAACTLVYDYDGKQVLSGWGDYLLDVEYDNWGVNSTWSEYLPDKNVICISYAKVEGGFGKKEYTVDLEKLEMEVYVKW